MTTTSTLTIKSDFASYVRADVTGDKAEHHALRMGHVFAALVTALKGNATPYDQATGACAGKTRNARAYKAAFSAVARPAKFPYSGKCTPEVLAQIEAKASELAIGFSAAFLAVAPIVAPVLEGEALAVAELKAEQAKTKREATAKQKALDIAKAAGFVPAGEVRDMVNLTPTALADIVADMLRSGAFTPENARHIADAANAAVKADKQAVKAIKGRASTTPKVDATIAA